MSTEFYNFYILAAAGYYPSLDSAYNEAIVSLYISATTGRFSFNVGPTQISTLL